MKKLTNKLPTKEDGYRIAERFKDTFGSEEFLLFPLDWGAARVADLVDSAKEDTGIHYIRYDLPVSSYSRGWYRPIPKPGMHVRRDLESGKTLWNSPEEPVYSAITSVDFSVQRDGVFFEDWLGFTGKALSGGVRWGAVNSGEDVLNLRKIYPAAIEAHRDLEIEIGKRRFWPLGELLLPHDPYPLTTSYRTLVVENGSR